MHRNGNCGRSYWKQRAAARSTWCWCGDWTVGADRWPGLTMLVRIIASTFAPRLFANSAEESWETLFLSAKARLSMI